MRQCFTNHEIADEVAKQIYGKQVWLEDFATGRNKRPDHEIERVTREMNVLHQVVAEFRRRATERDRGAA